MAAASTSLTHLAVAKFICLPTFTTLSSSINVKDSWKAIKDSLTLRLYSQLLIGQKDFQIEKCRWDSIRTCRWMSNVARFCQTEMTKIAFYFTVGWWFVLTVYICLPTLAKMISSISFWKFHFRVNYLSCKSVNGMKFYITAFERTAKIRKIAVYHFFITFLIPELRQFNGA